MVPLSEEKSIEVLRLFATTLVDEVTTLRKEISRLRNRLDDEKQSTFPAVMDQLSRLQQRYFGGGQEKLENAARPLGHVKENLLLHGARPIAENAEKEKPILPRDVVVYKMTEEMLSEEARVRKIEPASSAAWEEIPGLFQESKEITVIERRYIETVNKRAKYRLKKEFNNSDKEVLVTAPGPVKVLPGCRYSVDFALAVVIDKYDFHLPLERQRRQMEANGISIDVKTLYGLCQKVAEICDKSVLAGIRKDILSEFSAVHVDETPWGLLGGTGGQMWTISNRLGAYYRFEPSRSGKIAEEMLKDYRGSVLTDGFSGYNRVRKMPGVRHGNCWSHARREFFERIGDFPKEATEAVELIDELFRLERTAKSFEELRVVRRNQSSIQIEKLRRWMLEVREKFLPQDGITKAIDYCLKLWPGLTLFLKDLSLPLTNNDAERALRHVVMGRKNFLGSKSIDGADVAATLYTVIETAKRAGLDPKKYLCYVLTEAWNGAKPLSPLNLARRLAQAPDQEDGVPQKDDWKI
jgi:transposase